MLNFQVEEKIKWEFGSKKKEIKNPGNGEYLR